MRILTMNIFSTESTKRISIKSPSLDNIVNAIHQLNIKTRDILRCYLSQRIYITVDAAEQNRVFVQWFNNGLVSHLLDKNLLDSTEKIETSDIQSGPFQISATVTRDEAITIISHLYNNGKFPKGSSWSEEMKDYIE